MAKPQLKQQQLEKQASSPNQRTKKKQRGTERDETMEDVGAELTRIAPKALFPGISADVTTLFQKPNNERWRKLPSTIKDKATAYT
jgi:hypothetical protein